MSRDRGGSAGLLASMSVTHAARKQGKGEKKDKRGQEEHQRGERSWKAEGVLEGGEEEEEEGGRGKRQNTFLVRQHSRLLQCLVRVFWQVFQYH